jgi:hypothetical protein
MRTLIVVIAFLGLAVCGCAESQPTYIHAVDPVEIDMSDESTSETNLYFVESITADGSREVRYKVKKFSPVQKSYVNSDGEEIVRTEMTPITEESVTVVPYGHDIAEFLRLSTSVEIVPLHTAPPVIPDVEPFPAPPVD